MLTLSALILLTLACTWLTLRHHRNRRRSPPLPPGPNTLTAHLAGPTNHTAFTKWTHQYGPIVSANIGTRTYIILGTRRAAQDLLDKRGSIYSSRAPSVLLDRYLHKGLAAAFMPYGPEWRLNRRLHASVLNVRAVDMYRGLQDSQSKLLLRSFLHSSDFSSAFHNYTADLMFTLAFGKGQGKGKDDADHRRIEQINEMATFVLQGASTMGVLLELFPFLDVLPRNLIMRWRSQAAAIHEKTKRVYSECCRSALEATDCWNWAREITSTQRKAGAETALLSDSDALSYSVGELYVAGVHTTRMVLEVVVLAALRYADTVRQAQAELDAVVGEERMPDFTDLDADKLPYIRAFVSEALRWKPISPIAVPHAVIQDDEYMGYRIPRGATVIANQYAMNMDEGVWGDPGVFRPGSAWVRKMSNCHLTSIDLNDPSQFTELAHQRRLCGWDYDPATLSTWKQLQTESLKVLFWIVTSSTSASSSSSSTNTTTDTSTNTTTTTDTDTKIYCGHISLEPTPTPKTLSIKTLFIHPTHRRSGTGRRAMQLIEKEASARGAQWLELTALSKRYVYEPEWRGIWETKFGVAPPAFSVQEWYEGMGFVVWKEEPVTEERGVDGEVVFLWEAFMRKGL
ncbi:cytochrome P450 [Aspergillus campestris IBT 28561]|uniref:Cytochrome P450 n=1 Tax=Aspergillus campestris (strain IBT 28561) TaxID=1392248 RepID=A0A2I1CZ37_ASPC2|nr:cytochrome P450 [Aspergillus campestris IBT 28561]PKY02885.1 cytochrome P450 [Aspergillus campestris IBT 28561]